MGDITMKRIAIALLALLTMAGPTQALTVSKEVGTLLKEAQTLIAAKDITGAVAKVGAAEAVRATADDEIVINQVRSFILLNSSHSPQP
jgi:hypothetical protein